MRPSFLIIGKTGQLARAFAEAMGRSAVVCGRPELDLCDLSYAGALEEALGGMPVEAVINTAAYTEVDKAETSEGRAEALRINSDAVAELALLCKHRNVPLVHFSSDYVFDGTADRPYQETDAPNPLNMYGKTKYAGEQAIIQSGCRYLIFRTSWVYDAHGQNFFTTMLRLMAEKESINVVSDQQGAPTYAPHLAQAVCTVLAKALEVQEFPSGLYHLCGSGETSWHGFAQAILGLARSHNSGQISSVLCQHVNPIPTSDYPTPAKRPLNSRLDCARVRKVFDVAMPDWQRSLHTCFDKKYENTRR